MCLPALLALAPAAGAAGAGTAAAGAAAAAGATAAASSTVMGLSLAQWALGLSAVQAGLQYSAQSASVSAANRAADINKRSAALSAAGQYRSVILGQIQEEDAAATEIARIERDAASAESTALLAGIEAGAGGRSLAERSREFRASALTYTSAVRRNLLYSRGAAAGNLQAISVGAMDRITGYRPAYERPSLLGAGLTLGKGYLDMQKFLAPPAP